MKNPDYSEQDWQREQNQLEELERIQERGEEKEKYYSTTGTVNVLLINHNTDGIKDCLCDICLKEAQKDRVQEKEENKEDDIYYAKVLAKQVTHYSEGAMKGTNYKLSANVAEVDCRACLKELQEFDPKEPKAGKSIP